MAKRLSEIQKENIIKFFIAGKTIDELATQFICSKLTISRNLKKNLGEKKFKELNKKSKSIIQVLNNDEENNSFKNKSNFPSKNNDNNEKTNIEKIGEEYFSLTPFIEITPLECVIENGPQKDLSSIPISQFKFPEIVYMIVDKNIELEIKYLKDYPDWQFLSKEDLNRKAIEIHLDIKIARRFCNKEQKAIKVPNTNVFKIVAPLLAAKGITRIVSDKKLIAL